MTSPTPASATPSPVNEDPLGSVSSGPPASPAVKKSNKSAASVLLSIILMILGFVAWPITFVVGLFIGLWQIRDRVFPLRARVGRQHFWITLLSLYGCGGFLLFAIIEGIIEAAGWPHAVRYAIFGVVGTGFAFSAVTVAIGRLHDQNFSGAWVLLCYGVPATAIAVYFALPLATTAGLLSQDSSNVLGSFAVIVIWPFILLSLIVLGCRRGTVGPNRFGPEVFWKPQTRAPVRRSLATASPSRTQKVSTETAVHSPSALVTPPSTAGAVASPPSAKRGPPVSMERHARIRQLIADLVSPRGRMDRSRYWTCTAIQCAYALAAWLVIHLVIKDRDISRRAYWISIGAIAFLPAALSMIASGVKRLHDGDRSGWWLPSSLVFLVAGMEVFVLISDHQFVAVDGSFIFAIWVVAIYQISRLSGTVGPNRFGPDPYDQDVPTDL